MGVFPLSTFNKEISQEEITEAFPNIDVSNVTDE